MSDDEDLLTASFAIRRRGGPGAATHSVASTAAAPSRKSQTPEVRMAREPRREAADERRREAAITNVTGARRAARSLALEGIAARNKLSVAAVTSPQSSAHEAATGAAVEPPASLAVAYEEASALHAAGGDAEPQLAAWRVVFALGMLEARRAEAAGASGADERDRALRAQMTALSRQAMLLAPAGHTRKAIACLEEVVRLSGLLARRDRVTLRNCVQVLHRAAELRVSIGSTERARAHLVAAAAIVRKLAPQPPPSGAQDAAVAATAETETLEAVVAQPSATATADTPNAPPDTSAVPSDAAVSSNPPAAGGASTVHAAAAVAEAFTSEAPVAPLAVAAAKPHANAASTSTDTGSAKDGERVTPPSSSAAARAGGTASVAKLFAVPSDASAAYFAVTSGMEALMLRGDAAPLVSILHRSLLGGEAGAAAALLPRYVVPSLGVTPLMAACAADAADLVTRLLVVPSSAKAVRAAVVETRDLRGNNAIMHAAGRGAHAALDAALCALLRDASAAASLPAAAAQPLAAEQAAAASVEAVLGIQPLALAKYTEGVRVRLLASVADPQRYLREGRPAKRAASGSTAATGAAASTAVTPQTLLPFAPQLDPRAFASYLQQQQQQQLQLQQQQMMVASAWAAAASNRHQGQLACSSPQQEQHHQRTALGAKSQASVAAVGRPRNASAPVPDTSVPAAAAAAARQGGDGQARPVVVVQRGLVDSADAAATQAQSGGPQPRNGAPVRERQLERMALDPPSSSPLLQELELADDKQKQSAAWDQFAANEELFGVRADSFREDLYTSKLEASTFTPAQVAAAEALAAEILARGGGGDGDAPDTNADGNEEARFSAVHGVRDHDGAFTDAGVARRERGGRGRGK